MRYLLLICADETLQLSPEESAAIPAATQAWVAEMDGRGVRLQGEPLRPVSEASTVRVRGGEVLVSDGPFAETKEQIGGFDIIECADLDEALEVASKHPVARFGTIEIRPLWVEELMRYLMIHRIDESATLSPAEDSDEEGSPAAQAVQAWVSEMESRGVKHYGGRLRPVSDATTVRVRGGEVLVADGPFAETKEQIAGFDVIECASPGEAIAVAARHPTACIGTFELRPRQAP